MIARPVGPVHRSLSHDLSAGSGEQDVCGTGELGGLVVPGTCGKRSVLVLSAPTPAPQPARNDEDYDKFASDADRSHVTVRGSGSMRAWSAMQGCMAVIACAARPAWHADPGPRLLSRAARDGICRVQPAPGPRVLGQPGSARTQRPAP